MHRVPPTRPEFGPHAIYEPAVSARYEPNLRTARAWALAASTARFLGEAVVTKEASRVEETCVTWATARLNTSRLADDGAANPLIFLTNCRAAARISSSAAGGSKLYRVLMFLHTVCSPLWVPTSRCHYNTSHSLPRRRAFHRQLLNR